MAVHSLQEDLVVVISHVVRIPFVMVLVGFVRRVSPVFHVREVDPFVSVRIVLISDFVFVVVRDVVLFLFFLVQAHQFGEFIDSVNFLSSSSVIQQTNVESSSSVFLLEF